MVEAAEGSNPERSWAPTSSSVLDLGFELTSFIFIDIMAKIE